MSLTSLGSFVYRQCDIKLGYLHQSYYGENGKIVAIWKSLMVNIWLGISPSDGKQKTSCNFAFSKTKTSTNIFLLLCKYTTSQFQDILQGTLGFVEGKYKKIENVHDKI